MIASNHKFREFDYQRHIYDSVSEMVQTTMTEGRYAQYQSLHGYVSRTEWIGRRFDSYEEIAEGANQPWAEGMELLQECREKLQQLDLPQPQDVRRRLRFRDDDGDEVDYDRLRSGQDFWRTTRRARTSASSIVTLAINCAESWEIDPVSISYRGAATVALTELLEAAGYRVELWAVWAMTQCFEPNRHYPFDGRLTAVRLKAPSDPLDLASLVNATSGWYLRLMYFGELAVGGRDVRPNRGFPRTASAGELADFIGSEPKLMDRAVGARQAIDRVVSIVRELQEA